jgi:hypothetical protein
MTEVLVAIFVMAIGLISLLVLFPLGALTMAQALKDGRTAQAAANAFAIAEARGIRFDPNLFPNNKPYDLLTDPTMSNNLSGGVVMSGFPVNLYGATIAVPGGTNAITNSGIHNGPSSVAASPYDGPGYPVYVDPIGVNLASTSLPGLPGFQIPRVTVSGIATLADAYRWFSLQDDLTFNSGDPTPGSAYLLGGSTVEREGRYTWAYLLRRPKYGINSMVDLTVVVYSGRPQQLPLGETAFAPNTGKSWTNGINFDPSTNKVNLPYTGVKPPVTKGTWILDATMVNDNYEPDPHGFFYRVVGVSDGPVVSGVPSVDLELQAPPRMPTQYLDAKRNLHTYGVLVIMDNVVEVFDKGLGWQP